MEFPEELRSFLTPEVVSYLFPGMDGFMAMRAIDNHEYLSIYDDSESEMMFSISEVRENNTELIQEKKRERTPSKPRRKAEAAKKRPVEKAVLNELLPELLSAEERRSIEMNEAAFAHAEKILKKLHAFEKKYAISIEKLDLIFNYSRRFSNVVIRPIYRIFLVDYDLSLDLRGLQKTSYIFFLKHPEGIILKDLPDYRSELLDIYESISSGAVDSESAIDNLCNNTETGSMDTQISRINRALKGCIEPSLAKYYQIIGEKIPGEDLKRYRIRLPGNLIHWEG